MHCFKEQTLLIILTASFLFPLPGSELDPVTKSYPNEGQLHTQIKSHIQLLSATTRDIDGNGYLDRIDLVFNKALQFPPESDITIHYGTKTFWTSNVVGKNGSNPNTEFSILLKESVTENFQTGWEPLLTIKGVDVLMSIDGVKVHDSAGPVIENVVIHPALGIPSCDNRAPDTLHISLSEPIEWPSNPNPNKLFTHYRYSSIQKNVYSSMSFKGKVAIVLLSPDFVTRPCDSVQLRATKQIKDTSDNTPPANGRKSNIDIEFIKSVKTSEGKDQLSLQDK